MICNCRYCLVMAVAVSLTMVYILRGYTFLGWKPTAFISIAVVAVMAGVCSQISKRTFCIAKKEEDI